jgi:hypothetical protein
MALFGDHGTYLKGITMKSFSDSIAHPGFVFAVDSDTGHVSADGELLATELMSIGKPSKEFYVTLRIGVGVNPANEKAKTCDSNPSHVIDQIEDFLKYTGLPYVDLVVLHGPCRKAKNAPENSAALDNEYFKTLETAVKSNLIRAIGAGDYESADMDAFHGDVYPYKPTVVQHTSGFSNDERSQRNFPMIQYCRTNGCIFANCDFGWCNTLS